MLDWHYASVDKAYTFNWVPESCFACYAVNLIVAMHIFNVECAHKSGSLVPSKEARL